MNTPLQAGAILQGRYRVLSVEGSRGAGFVYRVGGLILEKEFALKEMCIDTRNPEEIARITRIFQNEAETLAKLDHPGIPKIYDAFFEHEKYYLVMDFIPGATLQRLLSENPQYFSEAEVLGWTEQIMEILEYLHTLPNPVIVRDMNPTNIMLTPEKEIRVIDFGIAKLFNSEDELPVKGRGTEGFAPPEQFDGEVADPRCDIYSLGATLYYLLTKKTLPNAPERAQKQEKINPPSFYNPMVSRNFDSMILKMLELLPQQRFQSIADMREFMNRNNLRQARESGAPSSLPETKARVDASRSLDRKSTETGSPSPAQEAAVPSPAQEAAVPPAPGMSCPGCGAPLKQDSVFCPQCGKKVTPDAPGKIVTPREEAPVKGIQISEPPAAVATSTSAAAGATTAPATPLSPPRPVAPPVAPAASPGGQPLPKKAPWLALCVIFVLAAVVICLFFVLHPGKGGKGESPAPSPSPSPSPTDAEYYISHGTQKFNEHDYRGAISDFDQVILLKPDNYSAYFKRGMAKCKVKEYDKALSDFTMALHLEPDSEEALNSRGLAYFETGDQEAALKDFKRLMDINPDAYWAFNNRGLVFLEKKKHREALDDFKMALEINPDDPDTLYNMAVLYEQKEDYEKALDYINRSIEKNPSADAYGKRGEIFRSDGNTDKALDDFNRAIELDADCARAYCDRGSIYFDRKEHKKAEADWKKADELDPDGPDGNDARESLKKL